jgi:hypothetical protein
MLAVIGAQERLDFESSRHHVERVQASTRSMVAAEHAEHELVAPDRAGTKAWRTKLDLLDRAIRALESPSDRDSREHIRRAIEDGPRHDATNRVAVSATDPTP